MKGQYSSRWYGLGGKSRWYGLSGTKSRVQCTDFIPPTVLLTASRRSIYLEEVSPLRRCAKNAPFSKYRAFQNGQETEQAEQEVNVQRRFQVRSKGKRKAQTGSLPKTYGGAYVAYQL